MNPYVGQIVLYHAGLGRNYAAIVTQINSAGTVELTVFSPDPRPYVARNVPYRPTPELHSWRSLQDAENDK